MDDVEVTYEVEDGYVGGSAPHYVSIPREDWDETPAEDRRALAEQMVREDFQQNISWYITNIEE